MCGIAGYTGRQPAWPVVREALKLLEYRGYDSAGFFGVDRNGVVYLKRAEGKLPNLVARVEQDPFAGTIGIGHTRWATHGRASEANAHPHADCSGTVYVVHNGIIENFAELRERLIEDGHEFHSQTDTEVIAHLIEDAQNDDPRMPIERAVRRALKNVRGHYALIVLDQKEPEKIVAVRAGNQPLIIGLGLDGLYVASAPVALIEHTRDVVYLGEGELAVLTPDDHRIFSRNGRPITKNVQHIEGSVEEVTKSGHPHYMLKEMLEQPEAIQNLFVFDRRFDPASGAIRLDVFNDIVPKRIVIVACGTSYHAGLAAKYMIQKYARVPVVVEVASEFRYSEPILDAESDLAIFVSQSGNTADTLEALEVAKRLGIRTLAIVNTVESSIAQGADRLAPLNIGPEIGVASTKAFIGQVTLFALIALDLAEKRGTLSPEKRRAFTRELANLPELIARVLAKRDEIRAVAERVRRKENILCLGRLMNSVTALEGALKIKELTYIPTEGDPAGEMKHGPIALIDAETESIVLCPHDSVYEKTLSNMQEVRARGGSITAIVTEGDRQVRDLDLADDVIEIPECSELVAPVLGVIPFQLLAYHIAVLRGYDPDQPRNLAKSVTVE